MNDDGALIGFSLVIVLVMAMAVVMAMVVVVVGWLGGVGVFAEIVGCFCFSCSLLLGCYCVEWRPFY